MVYRQLRIVTIILVTAVVLSCICTALVRKFVFSPPTHKQEADSISDAERNADTCPIYNCKIFYQFIHGGQVIRQITKFAVLVLIVCGLLITQALFA